MMIPIIIIWGDNSSSFLYTKRRREIISFSRWNIRAFIISWNDSLSELSSWWPLSIRFFLHDSLHHLKISRWNEWKGSEDWENRIRFQCFNWSSWYVLDFIWFCSMSVRMHLFSTHSSLHRLTATSSITQVFIHFSLIIIYVIISRLEMRERIGESREGDKETRWDKSDPNLHVRWTPKKVDQEMISGIKPTSRETQFSGWMNPASGIGIMMMKRLISSEDIISSHMLEKWMEQFFVDDERYFPLRMKNGYYWIRDVICWCFGSWCLEPETQTKYT